MTSRAYGIDLGTTYSVIATIGTDGRPTVLRTDVGGETTPSVVCFESAGSVLVGAAAKDAAPVLPDQTVALIKRRMGTDITLTFHDVEYSPEAISSLILRGLVDGTVGKDRSGDPLPVVVTVPAYFGIREREATQEACLLAGLRPLELVTEPLAAAIHYGMSEPDGQPVLVYDLGGGTFDATVLDFAGGAHAVATDGDTELGGADWDRRLAAFLLEQYVAQQAPDDDPEDDTAFMTELLAVAEQTKKALSDRLSHRVSLRRAGTTFTLTVTRDEFATMTRDLVDSSLACVRRLLAAAGKRGVASVSQCLLVGGSSRMPMVADALRAEFGWTVRLHDPDLAVAKGAALRAADLIRGGEAWVTPEWGDEAAVPRQRREDGDTHEGTGPSAVASVVSRSLGLLVHDSSDKAAERTFVQHVIHQNDPLPVIEREVVVATIVNGQQAIRIEVLEQAGAVESEDPIDNRRVLDGELSGLPDKLKAGSPIRVRLTLGHDGRLSLSATEPKSGTTLTLEAYIDGVLDSTDRIRMAEGLRHLAVRR